jgi:hypothetical protein
MFKQWKARWQERREQHKKYREMAILEKNYRIAMYNLAQQEWSVDFLIYLLRKSQIRGLTIRVTEPNGKVLELTGITPVQQHNDFAAQEKALSQDEWDVLLGIR